MRAAAVCRAIASNVERGQMHQAVAQLVLTHDLEHEDRVPDSAITHEKTHLPVDLAGEDGNVFFLVCKCIAALVADDQIAHASTVLTEYTQHGDYGATVAFLREYVDF